MALLERIERVQKLLTVRGDEDVREALIEAMEAATETIADGLRTPLERATVEDFFLVAASRQYGPSVRRRRDDRSSDRFASSLVPSQTELLLSRGFVDEAAQTVALTTSGEMEALKGGTSTLVIDLVAEERVDVNVEAEAGIVRVSDYSFAGSYVKVAYTAGFTQDGGDPALFDPDTVPGWLKQASLLQASMTLILNPALNPFQGDAGPSVDQLKFVDRQLGQLIGSHARYAPMSVKPIFSSVTLV